jgi:hypothetical protein
MTKKKRPLKTYDYDDRPKGWAKKGYRWNGEQWSQHCLCHGKPWKQHDKILNEEVKNGRS